MNNVVVITAMRGEVDVSYKNICIYTWKYWCNKHNVKLFLLDDPVIDILILKPTWQRWYVCDILDNNNIEYDNIALIDVDTMIHWNAPNIFDYSRNQFSVCVDNDNIGWVLQSIDGYKHFFNNVDIDWEQYFNCGVIVFNKTHKEICQKVLDFEKNNHTELLSLQTTLRKGTDQTPVNYIVRQNNVNINFLSKKWNLTHLNRKEILHNAMFINVGWIWHFNGFDKNQRYQLMNETWNIVKSKYENK